MFYEEYSSETFASTVEKYLNSEFVQALTAQIETTSITSSTGAKSRSMSPTMIAEYKRILTPQERLLQQLDEYCNLFLTKK